MELRDDGENRGSSEGRQTRVIERVEDGVDGRRTKGIEAMEDGVEGRQARENEKIDGVESHHAKVSEKDGGEKASGKGGRDKVGWLGKVTEEDQKKPMVWACTRQ